MESGRVVEKGIIKERARSANPATSCGGVVVLKTRAIACFTQSRRSRNAQRAWRRATRRRPTGGHGSGSGSWRSIAFRSHYRKEAKAHR